MFSTKTAQRTTSEGRINPFKWICKSACLLWRARSCYFLNMIRNRHIKPSCIMWRVNVVTPTWRHKTFPLSAPYWTWQRLPLSYRSWKLTFHTVHFMHPLWCLIHQKSIFSLSLLAKPGLSVKGREHVANLSQHGRGREICILNFKELFREAENINAYFLKQPPTVELYIIRMWNHSVLWQRLTFSYVVAIFWNQKSINLLIKSHCVPN